MASTLRKNTPAPILISSKPKKRIPIKFEEDGPTYMVKPPKTILLLAIASRSSQKDGDAGDVKTDFDNILKLMFEPKDLAKIRDRLNSPDDDLDFDQIFETVEAVTEAQTGDPTS